MVKNRQQCLFNHSIKQPQNNAMIGIRRLTMSKQLTWDLFFYYALITVNTTNFKDNF